MHEGRKPGYSAVIIEPLKRACAQGTSEWLQARQNRLTGSNFGAAVGLSLLLPSCARLAKSCLRVVPQCCLARVKKNSAGHNKYKSPEQLAHDMLYSTFEGNDATRWSPALFWPGPLVPRHITPRTVPLPPSRLCVCVCTCVYVLTALCLALRRSVVRFPRHCLHTVNACCMLSAGEMHMRPSRAKSIHFPAVLSLEEVRTGERALTFT